MSTSSDRTHTSWEKLGETETQSNTLEPEFVKAFQLDYYFECEQKMMFEVYDVDSSKREHIGTAEVNYYFIYGMYILDHFG